MMLIFRFLKISIFQKIEINFSLGCLLTNKSRYTTNNTRNYTMNMLTPHRRNPSRRRQAPRRYEDEKFVSGRIDQYTRGYEGRDSNWKKDAEDAENYYRHMNGSKICHVVWNKRGKI